MTELQSLSQSAMDQIKLAYRPKTRKSYALQFRTFVAFCICMQISIFDVNLQHILCFMQFLSNSELSVHMIANYLSAVKANFILYGLNDAVFQNQKIKLYMKSLKINRPLKPVQRNIMSIETLKRVATLCKNVFMGSVYRAVFLVAYFGFLRLSNMAPHSVSLFDPTRHLTAADVTFTKKFLKINLKWSKTIQTRDKVQVLTLPKLHAPVICPYRAVEDLFKLYNPSHQQPLFQVRSGKHWVVLTDSKIRKVLTKINIKLGFEPHHFTFHTFRRSGATLAYNSHIPVRQIKRHGSWTSDCVWTYIQQDQAYGERIARSFAAVLDDA